MENCDNCKALKEAFEASIQLVYYVLQHDLTISSKMQIKTQMDDMLKDINGDTENNSI